MKQSVLLLLMALSTAAQQRDRPEIVQVVKGSPEHPRSESGDLVQLRDGSWFQVFCEWSAAPDPNQVADPKLAAIFRRAGVGHDLAPCNLIGIYSRDGGRTWGDRHVVIRNQAPDLNVAPASLLRLDNGEIMLQYHRVHSGPSTSGFVQFSRDETKTWSAPVRVWGPTDSEHIFAANSVLRQLTNGRIVLPAQFNLGAHYVHMSPRRSFTFWSDDRGRTWTRGRSLVELPLRGAQEPTVAQRGDGSLLMVVRNQLGSPFFSESHDGETWSLPQTSGLVGPESRSSIARIPGSNELVIVWNHASYQPGHHHYGIRTPLSIAVSRDGGRTWSAPKSIESHPNYEYTNVGLAFGSGQLLVQYLASEMEPNGKFGRQAMEMRVAILPLDWIRKNR